jgi:phosphate transport system substrate-binding protein
MRKFYFTFLVLLLVASFVFAGGGRDAGQQAPAQAAGPYTITVGGSTSVAPLMEMFKAEYERLHGNITITISASGSGDGIRGAAAGTFEIGMTSRDLTPTEKGTDIREILVAIDGIGVIVNNNNPVSDLSQAQLRDIYIGSVTRWEQLGLAAQGMTGPIAVVSRESGSGTRGAFEEILNFRDQLVSGAIEFASTGAVMAEVSRNVHAIGYISLGSVNNTIKALDIDGVTPNTPNVQAGSYRIARPFILLTRRSGTLNPNAQAFLDWALSSDGQNIVNRSWIGVH